MNDLEQRVPVGVTNIAKLMPNPEALLTIPQNERNPGGLIDVRIENLRRQLREKYKDMSPERINFVLDFFFGPFNFKEFDRDKRYSRDEARAIKTRSASIQHLMTHMALHAGSENVDPQFQLKIAKQLEKYQEIATSRFGRDMELNKFLKGVMAEIGVVKALLSSGCEVILPDYQPQKSFEDSPVCQMDVDRGIDLIAVKGADIFLVDAKGTRYFEEPTTKKTRVDASGNPLVRNTVDIVEQQKYEWNLPSLRGVSGVEEVFRQHPSATVHKLMIKIPTSEEFLPPINLQDGRPVGNSIRSFARLNSELTNDIIMGLDRSRLSRMGLQLSTSNEEAVNAKSA